MTEDQLQQAYQRAKQQHKAPAASRRLVLAKAQRHAGQKGHKVNPWNWTMGSIAASALLAMYVLLNFPLPLHQPSADNLMTTLVEVHHLNNEPIPDSVSQSIARQASITRQYDNLTREFANAQQTIAAHHMRRATLISDNHEWRLMTCDQHLIILTPALVARLTTDQGVALKPGSKVQLSFDKDGHIVAISSAHHHACQAS